MSHVCKNLEQSWYVGGTNFSIIVIIYASRESHDEQAEKRPNKIVNDIDKCPKGWLRCVNKVGRRSSFNGVLRESMSWSL